MRESGWATVKMLAPVSPSPSRSKRLPYTHTHTHTMSRCSRIALPGALSRHLTEGPSCGPGSAVEGPSGSAASAAKIAEAGEANNNILCAVVGGAPTTPHVLRTWHLKSAPTLSRASPERMQSHGLRDVFRVRVMRDVTCEAASIIRAGAGACAGCASCFPGLLFCPGGVPAGVSTRSPGLSPGGAHAQRYKWQGQGAGNHTSCLLAWSCVHAHR